MKLLLDQGMPKLAAQLLRDADIDTLHVSEVDMSAAEDLAILQFAIRDRRVVATLDADFHSLLAVGDYLWPSVIRVRIEGIKSQAMTKLLLIVIEQFSIELTEGSAVTVDENRVCIRRLPLIPRK
jgi:predicted nuclease of predicted toxin-antitoxin system